MSETVAVDDRLVESLLTLAEAAAVTGRSAEAIRTMIRRRKLVARKGNDGKWLVELPVSMRQPGGQEHGQAVNGKGGNGRVAKADQPVSDRSVSPVVDQLTARLAEIEAVEAELRLDVEHWRDRAEQEALARAKAEGRVEARDQLVTELRKLLDDARRPWWRRWLDG